MAIMDNGRSPTMSIENRRPKMTLYIILKTRQSASTCIRDRLFNLQGGLWFFVSLRKKISDNTRVRIFFFCRAKRKFVFQNLTLGYMTNTLNQIFFLHQNQNIFFSNIGNQNIFLEKNHTPSPPSS